MFVTNSCSSLSSASPSASGEGRVLRAAAVWQTPMCSSLGHNRSCVQWCVQERKGKGGREGPSEHAFPPCLLRVNHTDKPDTPTFFRQAEGVRMTGDVPSRTPMTTSRNMERLPSIMASPRWSCGGSQTTHPHTARNSTQRYVASAWCYLGGQFSKSILVIFHRSPFQLPATVRRSRCKK